MTLNRGFYGPEKVQNGVQDKRKEKGGRREERKDYATFCIYIDNFGEKSEKPLAFAPHPQRSVA